MTIDGLIEALLFSRSEPWTLGELAKTIGKERNDIEEAVRTLEEKLSERGIILVRADDTVTLGTHPEASALLQKLYKEELEKPLSKASVETLSIILYGEEVTRGKIDYIRGVNSSFILRSLLVRGLIERKLYPYDRKQYMYVPTAELLSQLGVGKVSTLKDYEKIHEELLKTENSESNDTDVPEATRT